MTDATLCTLWTNLSNIGRGLKNKGNTCFINAVLQCLIHTPPFLQALSVWNAGQNNQALGRTYPSSQSFDASDAFFHAVGAVRGEVALEPVVAPYAILSWVATLPELFVPNRQEDAHEFLHILLRTVDSNLLSKWNLWVFQFSSYSKCLLTR